jgi:hypothetical protein
VLAAMQPHHLPTMDCCDMTVNINTAIITNITNTNVEPLQSTPAG